MRLSITATTDKFYWLPATTKLQFAARLPSTISPISSKEKSRRMYSPTTATSSIPIYPHTLRKAAPQRSPMRRAIRTSHDLQPPGYRCRSISMTNDPSTQRYLGTLYSNGYFNDDTEGLRWLLVVVLRALCRLAAELAIILGVVSIIDQSRRTHDLQDMWSSAFIAPMAVLIAVALVSLLLSLKALRSK